MEISDQGRLDLVDHVQLDLVDYVRLDLLGLVDLVDQFADLNFDLFVELPNLLMKSIVLSTHT